MNLPERLTYIVTGATSFIGSKLVAELLSQGNKVYAICRPNSKKISSLTAHDNLRIIQIDYDSIREIDKIIGEGDVFINLAWKGNTHEGRNDEEINCSNIANTLEAMKAAKRMGCRLFVESGSQAEYGYMDEITDEKSPCNPFTAYGKAKLEVLKRCSLLAKNIGIRYLHLRIFSVYGRNDREYTLFRTCMSRMRSNEPISLSECTQKWNFLYIDDAVSIIIALTKKFYSKLKNGNTEVVNVASKDTRQLSEFVIEMKRVINSSSELKFGDYKADRLLSIIPSTDKLFSIISSDFPLRDFKAGVLTSLNE